MQYILEGLAAYGLIGAVFALAVARRIWAERANHVATLFGQILWLILALWIVVVIWPFFLVIMVKSLIVFVKMKISEGFSSVEDDFKGGIK